MTTDAPLERISQRVSALLWRVGVFYSRSIARLDISLFAVMLRNRLRGSPRLQTLDILAKYQALTRAELVEVEVLRKQNAHDRRQLGQRQYAICSKLSLLNQMIREQSEAAPLQEQNSP